MWWTPDLPSLHSFLSFYIILSSLKLCKYIRGRLLLSPTGFLPLPALGSILLSVFFFKSNHSCWQQFFSPSINIYFFHVLHRKSTSARYRWRPQTKVPVDWLPATALWRPHRGPALWGEGGWGSVRPLQVRSSPFFPQNFRRPTRMNVEPHFSA